jgi:hypothetical protein
MISPFFLTSSWRAILKFFFLKSDMIANDVHYPAITSWFGEMPCLLEMKTTIQTLHHRYGIMNGHPFWYSPLHIGSHAEGIGLEYLNDFGKNAADCSCSIMKVTRGGHGQCDM